MDLNDIPAMKSLGTQMKYLAARQDAVSENIAFSDTPGYERKDIKQPDFGNMLKSAMLPMTTTDPKHISGNNSASSMFKLESTGEKVQLDTEAMELTKNTSDYSRATATYRKMIGLFNIAVGNNQ